MLDPSTLTRRIERFAGRQRKRLVAALVERRFTLPPELRQDHRISAALACLEARWPETRDPARDPERPVFLLSAGWRSGSTLLQRLLVGSGEIAVWGEPLGETGLIARLAHALTLIDARWPPDKFFARRGDQDLDGAMVKYEDLIAGRIDLAGLAASIGLRRIDPSPLERRIGSPTATRKRPKPRLSGQVPALI